jgi:cysteine synthase A
MARYDNILDTIGNTPLVRIHKLAPAGSNVYAKIESFNPMGSIKDRMARAIIEDAEVRGLLRPGQTVIEATSGNTGIGLAMVCAQKGYPLVVTMAESFSVERRKLLRFLGARVVLTPASEKGTGMLNKAIELAAKHGYFLCRQFENPVNAEVHARTTAAEIIDDFAGEQLDYWVSGFGTGGTLMGVARTLKRAFPGIKIIAAEPDNSPILASGIPQPRNGDGSASESHPLFRPHLMQGWAPDFISKLTEQAQAEGLIDEIVPVAGADALRCARELASTEGIFCGISSGATLAAAFAVARRAPPQSNIVCMLPDTGERYLSTPLFEHIGEEMTEAELEISRSTPGYRFDTAAPAPKPTQDSTQTAAGAATTSGARTSGAATPAATVGAAAGATPGATAKATTARAANTGASASVTKASTLTDATTAAPVVLEPGAERFVDEVVRDESVVLFALEWCEFCWSVRKLFARLGIEYRSVDLDSVAYQQDNRGGKIRDVLAERTGARTIPQVFVAGRHIGGCTETFDAWRDGSMQRLLDQHAIAYRRSVDIDPYSLLPKWLQPRKSA